MALSTVTVPTGWQPIGGNSLTYVFSESVLTGKPNYRVEIQVWDVDDGVQFSSAKFQFSPDSAGKITCDMSEVFRRLLTFGDVGVTTGIKKLRQTHYRNLYIKYEGVWTGGSTGQVSLSGSPVNPFNAVKNYLTDRSGNYPAEFLNDDSTGTWGGVLPPSFNKTIFPGAGTNPVLNSTNKQNTMQAWVGFPAWLDAQVKRSTNPMGLFVARDGSSTWMRKDVYLAGVGGNENMMGTTWNFDIVDNFQVFMAGGSTVIQEFLGTTRQQDYRIYSGSTPVKLAQTFTAVSTHCVHFYLSGVIKHGKPTATYNFRIEQTTAGLPNGTVVTNSSVDLKVDAHISGEDLFVYNPSIALTNGTVYALVISVNSDGFTDINNCLNFGATTSSVYASGQVATYNGAVWSAVGTADLIGGWIHGTPNALAAMGTISTRMNIQTNTPGDNAVYLAWLTEIGARVGYVFDFSQEQGFRLDTGLQRRFGQLRCFAQVSAEDWIMINELNKLGDRFSDYKKIGQRVLDLTQLAAYQPVWVVPTASKRRTRQIEANADVTIEYAELQQNRITP